MVILTKMGSDDSMYQTFVGAAKAVCDRYGLEEHDVIWIEHYKGNESRPSTFAEVWNVNTDIHFRGPYLGLNRRTIENPEAEALTALISDTFMTSAPPFMK